MPERIDTKAVLERKAPFRERAKGGPWGPWKQHFREAYDALAQEIADREALEKAAREYLNWHRRQKSEPESPADFLNDDLKEDELGDALAAALAEEKP